MIVHRAYGGIRAGCVALLGILFPSWPAWSQDNPNPTKYKLLPTIEAGVGPLRVIADAKDEIGKKGVGSGAGFYLNLHRQSWVYGAGIVIAGQRAEGSSDNRGIKQTFRVIAPGVGLHGFYEVVDSVLLGLQSTTIYGKGAQFDPWAIDRVSLVSYLGPRAEWYKDVSRYRFSIFGQVLSSLNAGDRRVVETQLGLTAAMVLDREEKRKPKVARKDKPKPQPARPAPPPEEIPKPVEAIPVQATPQKITLSSQVVSFDLDSIILRPQSKKFLEKFAAILVRYQNSWDTLTISGHTDISGKKERNEYLSHWRALSVRSVFVLHGVPEDRLTSAGYAFRVLLPGLPPNAPEHRRVELEFGELTGPDATAMVQSLNALIEEYKAKL